MGRHEKAWNLPFYCACLLGRFNQDAYQPPRQEQLAINREKRGCAYIWGDLCMFEGRVGEYSSKQIPLPLTQPLAQPHYAFISEDDWRPEATLWKKSGSFSSCYHVSGVINFIKQQQNPTLFFLHEYQDEVSAAASSTRAWENNSYRQCHSLVQIKCWAAWEHRSRAQGTMGAQKPSARHHGNADVKLQILGIKGKEGEPGREAGVQARSYKATGKQRGDGVGWAFQEIG